MKGSKPARKSSVTGIKWNFLSAMTEKDGPLTLGLHKKGSTYDVLTAADCKLVHADMNRDPDLRPGIFSGKRGIGYYQKMQHTGYLRHLLLRRGDATGEILVNLVTTTQEEHDLSDRWWSVLLNLELEGRIVGILHISERFSVRCGTRAMRPRSCMDRITSMKTSWDMEFKITPFSFFQPNSRGAEVLYETVRDYIGDIQDHDGVRSVQRNRDHRPGSGAGGQNR